MINQVCGGLGHAPGVARRADAAPLAGESDQEIVAALRTTRTGKAVGQNAALQIPSQLTFHVAGYRVTIAVASQREVGLQVLLDEAVEDGLLEVSRCCWTRR